MSAYRKILRQELINCLNGLYEEKGSWWQTIVDDDQVFILVRDNHLRVLVHGALLLKIDIDNAGEIVRKIHEDYLNLRSEDGPYVKISENHTAPAKRVEGLVDFVRYYGQIKSWTKRLRDDDKERQHCHTMSLNIKEIVDREVGLIPEKSEDTNQNKAQHVDFQSVSDDGKMIFVEVKLFGNHEIQSLKTPPVVNQLRKYEFILKSHEQKIIKAYAEQCETYSQLKGAFFKKKLPDPSNIHIFPRVRLIITDFDGAQLKYFLPKIKEDIENGMDWGQNTNNLIMIGNPSYINAGHIFKGI
jgi:hypothetical protein